MRNNYPGKCNTCSAPVAAGAGEARKVNGRWIVLCAAHSAGVTAAAAALALVIRVWIAAGRVLCAPVSRLNGSFDKYLAATRSAGFIYSKADNAQAGDIGRAHALIDALKADGFTCDVAPELVATMQARAARAQGDVVAANSRAAEIDALLQKVGKALMPFQGHGVNWLAPRDKAVLGDDMGLGKTIQALCAAPVGKPIVVICPAVAKGVWVRECKRFRPDLTPVALDGRGSFRWAQPGELVITNFDVLPHVEDAASIKPKKANTAEAYTRASWEHTLRAPLRFGETAWQRIGKAMQIEARYTKAFHAMWERIGLRVQGDYVLATVTAECVVIADEAHNLKSSKASRSARFRALARAARSKGGRTWLLTATPILNRPQELWTVLQAMEAARETFGSFDNYKRLWNAEDGRFGIVWGQPTAEVAKRMQSIMLRRIKAEVLTQLPSKTVRDVEVNGLSASTKKLCDAALAALDAAGIDLAEAVKLAESTAKASVAFEAVSKARAALAAAKLNAAIDMIEPFEDAGEPVVVFSAHRAPIDALATREGWAVITGDTPAAKRTAIEDAFQAGQLKGVACTIKAGGVAITLTKACNEIFIDEEWTPALNEQAQDRCYRIGQNRGVVVTRLVAAHALDRRVAELTEAKTAIINGSVNDARRGADEAVATVIPTVDAAALASDAQAAQTARQALDAATASLAAMLKAEESQPDIEIPVAEECPF